MADKQRKNKRPDRRESKPSIAERLRALSGPLTFAIVVVAVLFTMSVLFRVSDIRVEGNTHYTDNEIIRAIDIEQGDNLFFFDRFAAVSRVFAKLPYIEQVSVERSLPNRVTIEVVESEALAYLQLGDEQWTIDHGAKVLGKAAEGEDVGLIPIVGIKPGTLMIGEQMLTEDNRQETVDYLAEVLYQMEERGLAPKVTRLDFTDENKVEFSYDGKYTVVLGGSDNIEYKFGMFIAVLDKLLVGDLGIIDVSSGTKAVFSPN